MYDKMDMNSSGFVSLSSDGEECKKPSQQQDRHSDGDPLLVKVAVVIYNIQE